MKKYNVIYADPPWNYKATNPTCKLEKKPETCSVEYYYPTMKLVEIKALPIKSIAEKNSVLFLWATTPMIQEAFATMAAWGFKYKTMITWEKTNRDCMGYWFRVCTEHLLVGIRGKVKAFRCMDRTLHSEPRLGHSYKPQYFRDLISTVIDGEKIELFARQRTEGWDVLGSDLDGQDIKKSIQSLIAPI